jgi:hypothetical protein
MVDFVASHFFEIERSLLVRLPRTIIIQILSSESLRIDSEDSLYEFTRERVGNDINDFELLEFIQFEYLSCGKMSQSHEVFRDLLSMGIWQAICVRLALKVSPESRNRRLTFSKERKKKRILPSGDQCLDGIIAHLSRKHSGNVHDLGIVTASSATAYDKYIARNATEFNTNSCFNSGDQPNQWLCYDFKDRRIRLTHYSIHSWGGEFFLRDWKIEGSDDNLNWSCLDERHDSTTNDGHPIGTFSVSKENECEYRFIRLLLTGNGTCNDDYLILYAFEVFGDLIEIGEK